MKHIAGRNVIVMDEFSRILEINISDSVNYLEIAKVRSDDEELRLLRDMGTIFRNVPFELSLLKLNLWCDIATGTVTPYVPKEFQVPISLRCIKFKCRC